MKKIYIWNDIGLYNDKVNPKRIDSFLRKIKKNIKRSNCKLEILDSKISKKYLNTISTLDNIVTIGTRPNKLVKNQKSYNIKSKRIIDKNGFAEKCKIELDESVLRLDHINIVEDIIVTGTTLITILDHIISKQKNIKINIYLLIGYSNVIEKIKNKYKNIEITCFNILEEKSVEESTCVFLSDLLYEKLGNVTYLEHFENKNIFDEYTQEFINEINKLKNQLKEKIGIVTITIGINYGNRLQNYALQEVINKFGYTAETFENIYQEKEINNKIKRSLTLFKKNIKYRKKLKLFKDFNNKYINFSKYKVKSFNTKTKIAKKYKYLICGSDQIWNMNYVGNSKANFLTFAPKYKRISYAPSISSLEISDNRKEEFYNYLSGIERLSCREIEGSKLIEEISKRKCTTVLDPTLLLNSYEWDKIKSNTQKNVTKKYIIKYFLGNITDEYEQYIKEYQKEKNLEVININEETLIDPTKFIELISNSELVCTDSYHGLLFSIIYKRPYVLFERLSNVVSMNSRFSSIHKLLELPNRNYKSIENKDVFNINYDLIFENIRKYQEISMNYLEESIGNKNDGNM